MRRRAIIVRAVLLAVAAGLAGVSVSAFVGHGRHQRELAAAEVAEIGAVDVDLSRPGVWDVSVSGRYRRAHGCALVLKVDDGAGAGGGAGRLLAGLKAQGVCIEEGGGEWGRDVIDLERVGDWGGGELHLCGFGGGASEFTCRVEVEEGAPLLAGRRQRLYARNALCGLETFPVLLEGIVAWGCAIVAAGITGGVMLRTLRGRRAARVEAVNERA